MTQLAMVIPLTGGYIVAFRIASAAIVLLCLYGFINPKWRDLISGDLYRLRGMRRTGAPASLRTHCLSLLFWSYTLFLSFQSATWTDDTAWKIMPFIVFMLGGMASSRADVNNYRRGY